jgi:prepilin-type N-terminal cleavage/methylation domain-containing protein
MKTFRERRAGFSLVELLVVIAILAVLTGLVSQIGGSVFGKASRSKAQSEMAAMRAGLENYRADNATFPRGQMSDALDPRANQDPRTASYIGASAELYAALSGRSSSGSAAQDTKAYMAFKADQTGRAGGLTYLRDPWGSSYGYSTARAQWMQTEVSAGRRPVEGDATPGYGADYDLWTTAKGTSAADVAKWVKTW